MVEKQLVGYKVVHKYKMLHREQLGKCKLAVDTKAQVLAVDMKVEGSEEGSTGCRRSDIESHNLVENSPVPIPGSNWVERRSAEVGSFVTLRGKLVEERVHSDDIHDIVLQFAEYHSKDSDFAGNSADWVFVWVSLWGLAGRE